MKKELVFTEFIVQFALSVIKPIIFIISFTPITLSLIYQDDLSSLIFYIFFSISFILIPALILLIIAIFFRLLPDIPDGKYEFFSKKHYIWLFKDLIIETVNSSSFLSNTLIRIKPIRFVYFSLVKMSNVSFIILANGVHILDPDRVSIGKFTFVGINSIFSGHLIKGNTLVLKEIKIGEGNMIGAFCAIACGVRTGDSCKIDSFVTINTDVSIGSGSIILGKTLIDDSVKIGRRVRIGKSCIVGSNTIIEDGAIIKDYLRIGNNKIIRKGEVVTSDIL